MRKISSKKEADEFNDNKDMTKLNRCEQYTGIRAGDEVRISCHWGKTVEGWVLWRGPEFVIICTSDNKKIPIPWAVIETIVEHGREKRNEVINDDIVMVISYQEAIKLDWTMLGSVIQEGYSHDEAYVFCKKNKFVLLGDRGNNRCEFIRFISKEELVIRIKEYKKDGVGKYMII